MILSRQFFLVLQVTPEHFDQLCIDNPDLRLELTKDGELIVMAPAIDMGKRKAPFKEIVVEKAIAQWLERVEKFPDRAIKTLLTRQEQRQ